MIQESLRSVRPELHAVEPHFGPFRAGDIRHSQADISKAKRLLGYAPVHAVAQGLDAAIPWYSATLAA